MRTIIIGAGIAGLGTAIRLAYKGHDVEVFEANSTAGGKLASIRLGSYRFDAGPSLFTMPHLVEDLLKLSPVKVPFFYRKKQVLCNYFFQDNTRFTAFADKQQYLEEAQKVFDADPQKLSQYFEIARKKYQYTAPLFLERSLHKAHTYWSGDTFKALLKSNQLHLNENLDGVNRRLLGNNPKLIQMFNRYATYNGSSPYRTPGIMSMIPHLEHHYGTFFPEGGMISITNALVKTAQHLGVKFHFGTPVDRIEVSKKRATGVRTGNQVTPAEVVISNMDIVPTYRNLLPGQKAPEKTLNQERSSSAIIFYWGIRGKFPELDLHNIFFSDRYRKEFEEIFEAKKVPEDPTIYLNISCKEQAEDAPEGSENWFVMVNVPADSGQMWDDEISRVRSTIIDRLSFILKRPIGSLIEKEDYLDPRRIQTRTSSYQGALYGAASNDKFAAFLRHPNFSRTIKNLHFCGGSVHPGGGIPLCLFSAKIVSELIPDAA
jgi:phytoene desaturase